MFMSYAKASARFGKTPGIPPGTKVTLPKSPTSVLHFNHPTATQRRQASVRITPTKFHPTVPPTITPGHVEWLFNPNEVRRFESIKDRLSPDVWETILRVKEERASQKQPITAGHSPDKESSVVYRAWRVEGSFGGEYLNVERKAAPWFTPHSTEKDTFTIDLGDFDDDTLVLLFDILRQQPAWHWSAKGKEGTPPNNLWNREDWMYYLEHHVVPLGSPHCINFLVHCLEPIAERLAPGNDILLHLKRDLGLARQPQDIAAVLRAYFKIDAKRHLSIITVPPAVKWPSTHIMPAAAKPAHPDTPQHSEPAHEEEDTEDDWIDTGIGYMKVPKADVKPVVDQAKAARDKAASMHNYKAFSAAFGGDPQVFSRIAGQLVADDSIFGDIFNDPHCMQWGEQFFKGLGQAMASSASGHASSTLYHRCTYGPITHVSVIFFAKDGRVAIAHHESINKVDTKTAMVDGLGIDTVGCAYSSYNTLVLINAVRTKYGLKPWTRDNLPIVTSFKMSGPPAAAFAVINNFNAVESFIQRCANQSLTQVGLDTHYGVDPNKTLSEAAQLVRAGKLVLTPLQAKLLQAEKHFALHPKVAPSGAEGSFVPGLATNNCGRFTLLCLFAAEAPALAGMRYSAEMDLADVADAMYKAGVLVDTDPKVIDLMRRGGYFKDPKTGVVTRDPLSFMALAFGWSLAAPGTPGAYPAHVSRLATPGQAQLDKDLQAMWVRLNATAQKNIDSFSTEIPAQHSALNALPPACPIQLLSDVDWPAVEAHVKALSPQDCDKRFASSDPVKAVVSLRATHDRFFALRNPKSHEITLLLQVKLVSDGARLNMEIGTSVLPSQRKKGLGFWGVVWACAWGRNRGATFLCGHHEKTDLGAAKILQKLGQVIHRPSSSTDPYQDFQIPLAPADEKTHWMEGFAQPLQFDRNPPPKK